MSKEIEGKGLIELLSKGAVLVDVREKKESEENGIIGEKNNWPLSTFELRKEEISQTRPTIFYCQSGLRSLKAAEIAESWTTQRVFSLKGGCLAFSEAKSSRQEQSDADLP